MVSLLIIGILSLWGIQSFTAIAEQTRSKTVINELFYHLSFARSEAIKRNHTISIYIDSEDGWGVFDEKDHKLLLSHNGIQKGDGLYFKGNAANSRILRFTPQGFISSKNASSFIYCPSKMPTYAKVIVLNRIGRARISDPEKRTCDGTPED